MMLDFNASNAVTGEYVSEQQIQQFDRDTLLAFTRKAT